MRKFWLVVYVLAVIASPFVFFALKHFFEWGVVDHFAVSPVHAMLAAVAWGFVVGLLGAYLYAIVNALFSEVFGLDIHEALTEFYDGVSRYVKSIRGRIKDLDAHLNKRACAFNPYEVSEIISKLSFFYRLAYLRWEKQISNDLCFARWQEKDGFVIFFVHKGLIFFRDGMYVVDPVYKKGDEGFRIAFEGLSIPYCFAAVYVKSNEADAFEGKMMNALIRIEQAKSLQVWFGHRTLVEYGNFNEYQRLYETT